MKQRLSSLSWRLSKWRRRAITMICRSIYRDSNTDTGATILVAGTGRSGTTWLADIVSEQFDSRLMFEPFHPVLVPEYAEFNYFQYMRPGDQDDVLDFFVNNLLEGRLRNAWVDRRLSRVFPRHRVVKTIRATLLLKWLHQRYPHVPTLFIIRHPCAVVRSRMKQNWATDGDLQPMLAQPGLVADFLADKVDTIRSASTPEEKHAAVWCIHNLVPLRQFASGEVSVVFYEDLVLRPMEELDRVFGLIGSPFDHGRVRSVRRPSTTSTAQSAIRTGEDAVSLWRKHLDPERVHRILAIVDAFGLGPLYEDSDTPRISPESVLNLSWN